MICLDKRGDLGDGWRLFDCLVNAFVNLAKHLRHSMTGLKSKIKCTFFLIITFHDILKIDLWCKRRNCSISKYAALFPLRICAKCWILLNNECRFKVTPFRHHACLLCTIQLFKNNWHVKMAATLETCNLICNLCFESYTTHTVYKIKATFCTECVDLYV